ncbi:MAG: hypothetical protein IKU61_05670, partial [Clostridia bacterium]|nr:hypothetical protein [Clostridia bacterium]
LTALLIGAYVFREELYIDYVAVTSSNEAIVSQEAENDRKTQEILDKLTDVTMRDLTEEERKMLESGLLSYEDALKLIMGETLASVTTAPSPEETTVVTEDTSAVTTTGSETTFEIIEAPEETSATTVATAPAVTVAVTSVKETPLTPDEENTVALRNRKNEIIAEIYLLRATYLNKIDELVEALKKEYIALPRNKHNTRGKLEMLERVVIPRGNALENECDDKMDSLLAELKGVLEALGEDKSLIKEIRNAYVEQKRLKKTELMNTYMPK